MKHQRSQLKHYDDEPTPPSRIFMNTSSAPGESNLDRLIESMEPVLHNDEFVFATVSSDINLQDLQPIMIFKETEGITLILPKPVADAQNVSAEFPCRMITLNIHSSLDAVGFLARITTRLAALEMGVNPVSAFYHDHLFVPSEKAEVALSELKLMSSELKT